jgi:hypothetical protein
MFGCFSLTLSPLCECPPALRPLGGESDTSSLSPSCAGSMSAERWGADARSVPVRGPNQSSPQSRRLRADPYRRQCRSVRCVGRRARRRRATRWLSQASRTYHGVEPGAGGRPRTLLRDEQFPAAPVERGDRSLDEAKLLFSVGPSSSPRTPGRTTPVSASRSSTGTKPRRFQGDIGGGAGNSRYASVSGHLFVTVHKLAALVEIDPVALKIVARRPRKGVRGCHGVLIAADCISPSRRVAARVAPSC